MSSQAPLASIIAYLRFPLRAEHRGGLCAGVQCPHCQRSRIQKWGGFAGRQRFRCRDCRRTFSTFTNTPLRWLKHPEPRYTKGVLAKYARLATGAEKGAVTEA